MDWREIYRKQNTSFFEKFTSIYYILLRFFVNFSSVHAFFQQMWYHSLSYSLGFLFKKTASKIMPSLSSRSQSNPNDDFFNTQNTKGHTCSQGGLATGTPSPGQAQPVAGTGQLQVPPPGVGRTAVGRKAAKKFLHRQPTSACRTVCSVARRNWLRTQARVLRMT